MMLSLLRSFHREYIVSLTKRWFFFLKQIPRLFILWMYGEVRGQFGELVSPSATWVLGIKCGSSDFGASAFVHRTNSQAQSNGFLERREASSKERGRGEERGSW